MRLLEQHEQVKVDKFNEEGGAFAKYIKELNLQDSLTKYYKSIETFEPFKVETRFNSIFGVECIYGNKFHPIFCINDFDIGYTVPLTCYITDFCERLATQELFLKYEYFKQIGSLYDVPSSDKLSFIISRPIKDDYFNVNKEFNVSEVVFKSSKLKHVINVFKANTIYNKYEFREPEFKTVTEQSFQKILSEISVLERAVI